MKNIEINELYDNLLDYVKDKFELQYFQNDFNKILTDILKKNDKNRNI